MTMEAWKYEIVIDALVGALKEKEGEIAVERKRVERLKAEIRRIREGGGLTVAPGPDIERRPGK